jgi:pimeloyl-ACP methyl ester carboxylesterase
MARKAAPAVALLLGLGLALAAAGVALAPAERPGLPADQPGVPARPEAPPVPSEAAPFERAPCPHLTEEEARREGVECGLLAVPERRAEPTDRSLQLAVAVLRARGPAPAADPILLLPGSAWHGHLDATAQWLRASIRERRDLILVDPRGTGWSTPSIDCPDIRYLQDELRAVDLPPDEIARRFTAAGIACRDRLVAAGHDLSAYHHAAVAADLADLRRALGIAEWNVYAIGHGTRIALTLLRDEPAGVRSVVLDSAVPPQVDEFRLAERIERSLATILADCAADPACLAAFPRLEEDVVALVTDLNERPLVVTVPHPLTGEQVSQLVNGDLAIAGYLLAQAATEFIPVLPLATRELLRRNEDVVSALAGMAAAGPGGLGPFNQGAAYSVRCRDEAAFADPRQALRDAAALPWLSGLFIRASEQAVCAVWPVGDPDPVETQPVRSDVPALVIAGEYDSLMPTAWSRAAAEPLGRATFVELPGVGHGPSRNVPCAVSIRDAFIDDPARAPNVDCVARLGPPMFVTDAVVNVGVFRAVRGLLAEPHPLHLAAVGGPGLVFAAAVATWPVAFLLRRRRGRRRPSIPLAGRLVGWLAIAQAVLGLAVMAGFAGFVWLGLETTPTILLFGLPAGSGPLFWLATVTAALAPVLVVGVAAVVAVRAPTQPSRWLLAAISLASAVFAGYLAWTGLVAP